MQLNALAIQSSGLTFLVKIPEGLDTPIDSALIFSRFTLQGFLGPPFFLFWGDNSYE